MSKVTLIRTALSKLRSASTSRSVAQQAATPSFSRPVRNLGDEAEALSRLVRGQTADRAAQVGRLQEEIAELTRLQAVRARGGINKARRRTFQKSGKLRQSAGTFENMTQGGVNRTNKLMDVLDIESQALEELMAQARDVSGVVGSATTKIRLPNGNTISMSPRLAAKRLDQEIARQQMRIDKLTDTINTVQTKTGDRFTQASGARQLADTLESQAQQMPKRRAPSQRRGMEIEQEISARAALLQKLQAPTENSARAVVKEMAEQSVKDAAAEAAGAVVPGAAKRSLKPWAKGNRLLSAGAGFGAFMGLEVGRGFAEDQANNAMAGDRLSGMIRGAADQRLEMLRAMAAMQRIQQGARQNLANLAMQQPHVFNEIMAGRQLAPGIVSVGGNRQEQMMRMAEVGSAMATGQFNGMGSPDALGLLSQYMS